MSFESTAIDKCRWAHITLIRSLSRVDSSMNQQLARTAEPFAATVAQIRFLFGVWTDMNFVWIMCGESLWTLRTFVRTLAGMKADMSLQIATFRKWFSAMVAYVRFFSSVIAFVRSSISSLMKPLVTISALVFLDTGMCVQVLS